LLTSTEAQILTGKCPQICRAASVAAQISICTFLPVKRAKAQILTGKCPQICRAASVAAQIASRRRFSSTFAPLI
jgi:hypothetical protein